MAKSFKKGDKVAVLNSTLSGRVFVECERATVVRHHGDNWYAVRIPEDDSGSSGVYERHVDPAAQADPHAFAHSLNAQLQASA